MPVVNPQPANPNMTLTQVVQTISFDVATDDINLNQINCFQNGQTLTIKLKEKSVTASLKAITKPGRQRVNCTAPSIENKGRFYWYSQPIFIPTKDGKWLD